MEKLYVGVDLHKTSCWVTVLDADGHVLESRRIGTTKPELLEFFGKVRKPAALAVEATLNWYYFLNVIEPLGLELHLVHALKTRAIASARIKHDRLDSRVLAELLRTGFLAEAWIAPRPVREERQLLRYRVHTVQWATRAKNSIHGVLNRNGIRSPFGSPFGVKGRSFLQEVELAEDGPLGSGRATGEAGSAGHPTGGAGPGDPQEGEGQSGGPGAGAGSGHRSLHRFADHRRGGRHSTISLGQAPGFLHGPGAVALRLGRASLGRADHQAGIECAALGAGAGGPSGSVESEILWFLPAAAGTARSQPGGRGPGPQAGGHRLLPLAARAACAGGVATGRKSSGAHLGWRMVRTSTSRV